MNNSKLLESLTQESALKILISAVQKAYKNNCYTMEETALLFTCIQKLTMNKGNISGNKTVIPKNKTVNPENKTIKI